MAEAQRAAKRKRYTSSVITLKVGEDEKEVTIHEDILKSHSPFFRAAVDKKWQEGKSRVIALPEDEIDVVVAYLDWLHTGQLQLEADEEEGLCDPFFHAQLYVWGEKIQDDEFCDATMSSMIAGFSVKNGSGVWIYPGEGPIRVIYEGTPPRSPARVFLVRAYVETGEKCLFENGKTEDYPSEFLSDLVRELLPRFSKDPDEFDGRRKEYFKKKLQ